MTPHIALQVALNSARQYNASEVNPAQKQNTTKTLMVFRAHSFIQDSNDEALEQATQI